MRIVHHSTKCNGQGIAEFAAFVNTPGGFSVDVTVIHKQDDPHLCREENASPWETTGYTELCDKVCQSSPIAGVTWVEWGDRVLEPKASKDTRGTVTYN